MIRITSFLLLCLMLCSCQSTKNTASSSSRFSERIDKASPRDIQSHTQKILVGKYQYELARNNETASSIYVETMWKMLSPTEDELELGITDVRTRFKINSREVRSSISNSQLHNLTFKAEVETSTGSQTGWSREVITPERREYLEEVFYDFETEFRSGVINF